VTFGGVTRTKRIGLKSIRPALVPATRVDHAGEAEWAVVAPFIEPNAGNSEHSTKMSRQVTGFPVSFF
jgi:hypothetical protein